MSDTEAVGTYANKCGLCDGTPRWSITRHGDVIHTWACTVHLVHILIDLLPPDRHRDSATVMDLNNRWRAP